MLPTMLPTLLHHPHRMGVALGFFVLVAALSGCASIDMDSIAESIKDADSTVEVRDDREDEPRRQRAQLAPMGKNEIVMYSLTTCRNSSARRAHVSSVKECPSPSTSLTKARAATRRCGGKLYASGYSSNELSTPVVEVNGHMLPNNPSMEEIRQHMNAPNGPDAPPPVAFSSPSARERTLHALINDYRRGAWPLARSALEVAHPRGAGPYSGPRRATPARRVQLAHLVGHWGVDGPAATPPITPPRPACGTSRRN